MKIEPDYGTVTMVLHWVRIKVTQCDGGTVLAFLSWRNLPWEVRTKWDWYFKYRAALAQVQHPRARVDLAWGNIDKPNRPQLEYQNKLRAKKGKITEVENKMRKAREQWNQLLPIDDDPVYKRAAAKLEGLRQELAELITQAPT